MPTVFTVTFLVGIGTYLIRASSLSLGSRVTWPDWVNKWLSFVTPAVLGGLLGPTIFLHGTAWVSMQSNVNLIPAIVTAIVAWWSRHLLWTIVAGVLCFVVVSQWIL